MKDVAIESLKRIDQSLAVELKLVTKNKSLRKRLQNSLKNGPFVSELTNTTQQRMNFGDAHITQPVSTSANSLALSRMQLATLKLALFLLLVVLATILTRIIWGGGIALWRGGAITIFVLALSAISYMPFINRGAQIKGLRSVYRVIRILGIGALLLLIGAALVSYWWLSCPVALLLVGLLFACIRTRFSHILSKVVERIA